MLILVWRVKCECPKCEMLCNRCVCVCVRWDGHSSMDFLELVLGSSREPREEPERRPEEPGDLKIARGLT